MSRSTNTAAAPVIEPQATAPEESASLNLAIIRGQCSSPADIRVLASGDVLAQLQITTRDSGRTLSVPVAVWSPAAWVEALDAGDEVVVVGHVRRRFFRAGGATASRVEIEAEAIAKARDRRRLAVLRRRFEAASAAFDG